MSVVGNSRDWHSFFQNDLIPTVLSFVVEAWEQMAKPRQDAHEDNITVKLYSALVNSKDRNVHPFLIRYQDVEVDTRLVKETGRKDIVFFPSNQEEIYFCLEAKRLNAIVSKRRKSLADEYVTKGMHRFVSRQYSAFVRHGGMLAYVLDGQVDRAIRNVERNVRTRVKALGMDAPGALLPSSVRPGDSHSRETHHRRTRMPGLFRLHHLFLGCPVNEAPPGNKSPEGAGPHAAKATHPPKD